MGFTAERRERLLVDFALEERGPRGVLGLGPLGAMARSVEGELSLNPVRALATSPPSLSTWRSLSASFLMERNWNCMPSAVDWPKYLAMSI